MAVNVRKALALTDEERAVLDKMMPEIDESLAAHYASSAELSARYITAVALNGRQRYWLRDIYHRKGWEVAFMELHRAVRIVFRPRIVGTSRYGKRNPMDAE